FTSTTSAETPGKIGTALNFNGSTSYIDTANIADNLPNMTVSVWIKTSDNRASIARFIVGKMVNYVSANGWALLINVSGCGGLNGKLSFLTQDNGGNDYNQYCTTTTWNDNKWHHVVGTLSGGVAGTITMFVDGVRQSLSNSSAG